MGRLDKTFKSKLNEEILSPEEQQKQQQENKDYLPITTPIGSPDDKLFTDVVSQGIDSSLEGFTKSKFEIKNSSLGNRKLFNFHRTELPILLRRLEEIGTPEALQWKEDIEKYQDTPVFTEGFKPIVNEATDNDWQFTSKNIDVDVDGLKEKFYPQSDYVEVYQQKINVSWHIVPEIRDYGIKSMFIMVDKIFGVIYYEVISPDENVPDEEGQKNVEDFKWEFKEQMNEMTFGDGVYPTEVQLDFQTMICTIVFG